jgi:hypothetical protein
MRPETAFNLFTYGVMPAWALLVFAPRWKWTQRIVHSVFIPVLMTVAYAYLLLFVAAPPPGANAASLEGAMRMFQEPWTAIVCWIHFLVFDLFVGAWEVRDAVRRKVPHLAVVPCVVLTNFFGPIGLLAYLAVRAITRRTFTLEEEARVVPSPSAPAEHVGSGLPAH